MTGDTGVTNVTVSVERRLPAEPGDQGTRKWHTDYHPGVRPAQSYGGEPRPFQWRRPVSPDTVTGRIRDSLWRTNKFVVIRDVVRIPKRNQKTASENQCYGNPNEIDLEENRKRDGETIQSATGYRSLNIETGCRM